MHIIVDHRQPNACALWWLLNQIVLIVGRFRSTQSELQQIRDIANLALTGTPIPQSLMPLEAKAMLGHI